jgi:hypothetical protein
MIKYYVANKNHLEFESNEQEYKNYKYWVFKYINEDNLSHREDGPAEEYSNGTKGWYKNGKLHREDGPALESYNGNKYWYKNGKLHREDGPAVELFNGEKHYWYNDEYVFVKTDKEFKQYLKMKVFI